MALQDKTEAATPKRRKDAREEGRVAKSVDMNSALVLLASVLMLKVGGPYAFKGMTSIVQDILGNLHHGTISIDSVGPLMLQYGIRALLICAPLMLAVGAVGVAANVAQVGLLLSSKAIKPDMKKLDPLKGIARLFSGRSFVELAKSCLKISIVGYVVYIFLKNEYPNMMGISGLSINASGAFVAGMCWKLLVKACIAMLVIAALDYMYQRWAYEQGMKMTKQEVKDEYKQTEGDPQIKGKIRQRQREIARKRMMQDVPKADVVITNPTHFAVAIKYNPDEMSAPMVVAKGQRLLAQRIREIAEANGVPIVENVPVARLLYKTVEVGEQIPEALYQTVAEILAYVYRLSNKAGSRH